ncbi:hypothetical protein T484DRAFT_1753816 [Baffinella frigidus]|nr:hypothetical protein T484DRAFT_1753816 [Cryptophyta sp. CCMP2293]
MSLDTIICSNYTESEHSKSVPAHYRIGHLPMRVFGKGGYGMGSVMAAMDAATIEEDDHEYITELSARAAHKTYTTASEDVFFLQAGLVASASRTSHGSNDMAITVGAFRTFLQVSYTKDCDKLMCDILASGRLCGDGSHNDNHPAYMTAIAWLWEMHPKTFMSSMAPHVGRNSSFQDLLTLLSVVTYNHFAPVERLWDGKLSITCIQTQRASLRAKEHVAWTDLLAVFGVTSKDVVHTATPKHLSRPRRPTATNAKYSPAVFRREETANGYISPYVSTPTTPSTPLNAKPSSVSLSTFATLDAGTAKRVPNKKNIWLDEAFKTQWRALRSELHRQDYGTVSGISCTAADYAALAQFVVSSFADGISAADEMVIKCAPHVGGIYDKCTKGVFASNSNGITHAIAHMVYSDLLDQRTVMAMYKSRVCADKS